MCSLRTRELDHLTQAATATVQFAEVRGYNLQGLRRGCAALIRAERGLSPTAKVAVNETMVLAFAKACAGRLVETEWIVPLQRVLARHGRSPKANFVIRDKAHGGLRVVIRGRSAVAVRTLPHPKRTGSGEGETQLFVAPAHERP